MAPAVSAECAPVVAIGIAVQESADQRVRFCAIPGGRVQRIQPSGQSKLGRRRRHSEHAFVGRGRTRTAVESAADMVIPRALAALLYISAASAEDLLRLGEPQLDRPTLMSLGI